MLNKTSLTSILLQQQRQSIVCLNRDINQSSSKSIALMTLKKQFDWKKNKPMKSCKDLETQLLWTKDITKKYCLGLNESTRGNILKQFTLTSLKVSFLTLKILHSLTTVKSRAGMACMLKTN